MTFRFLHNRRAPHSTLESRDLFFGVRLGWYAAFCGWGGGGGHCDTKCLICSILLAFLFIFPTGLNRLGLADISRERRGWRQEWHGWAHGPASGEREGWLEPGRARQKAGAAVTAQRTLPQLPPGARTGRRGPMASSHLSGMQVLLLKCLDSAGVCCKGCISASVVSLQLDPYAFG